MKNFLVVNFFSFLPFSFTHLKFLYSITELNVPNILLKGFLNRRSFSYLINDSEIVIRTGEPRLRIFGCEWDKKRFQVIKFCFSILLQLYEIINKQITR